MPVTADDDDQGQPPEAPWHHSTPAVAGASAAALAVIGLVLGAGDALALKPGMCRLADGSPLTGWRATLTLDGGEVRDGCAWER